MQPPLGGRGVIVQPQRDVCRTADGAAVPSRRARRRPDLRQALGEERGARPRREPRIPARGLAQRRRAAATDPDRRTTRAMRLGLHRDVVQREMLAAEAHAVAGPQRATDLQRLEEAADAALPRHADGGELPADRRRVGGDADAEDHAALRHAVERADDVRQRHGIAQRGQQHAGAQPHARRARGDRGQQRERLVARPRRDRVADPDGVEAGRLRALGHGQQRRRLRAPGHHRLARGDEHAELGRHRYRRAIRRRNAAPYSKP